MKSTATVTVPATTANLGPGYDSLGLALEIRDFVTVTMTNSGRVNVTIEGQGKDSLPTDETHLVAKTFIDACTKFGVNIDGLDFVCRNAIPQGRGLGSSAAAIVSGLVLAREIAQSSATEDDLLQMAHAIEGHPDNVAACLLGGMTVAWVDQAGLANAVSMNVNPEIYPAVGVPKVELSTKKARGVIPATIPHVDGAFNSARSALLVAAMIGDPSFLLEATSDRLHQEYRREIYPESMGLVDALRNKGVASCISGAGPSVLALCTAQNAEATLEYIAACGFVAIPVPVADEGAIVLPDEVG